MSSCRQSEEQADLRILHPNINKNDAITKPSTQYVVVEEEEE